MMNEQLTIDRLLERSRALYGNTEIVTRLSNGELHRYTYSDCYRRTHRLMSALRRLGIRQGDRVASFGWNSSNHMELYLGVPSLGAVLHTINIRLSGAQIEFLANHAEDRVLFIDRSLLPQIVPIRDKLRTIEHLVVLDDHPAEAVPLPDGAITYESLIASGDERVDYPTLSEEDAATLCYTSGTTGVLKGVLYSHRSIFLHAMGLTMADSFALSSSDSVLQIVPMFHVNGWGIPYAACLTGAKLVFPGPHVVGPPVADLLQRERVTAAAGVPSVWYLLHHVLASGKYDVSPLKRILIGGAAAPKGLIETYAKEFGIRTLHAWGMTEVSPVGTINVLQPFMKEWPQERQFAQLSKQGQPAALVEVKTVDDDGKEMPRDGTSIGELLVRGPWIARGYYNHDGDGPVTPDGWLRTGDVATIDEYGYVAIADRKKDLIKTRGEWLSSVEMENAAMAHAAILEAAVVGRPDELRGEAVVLFIVPRPDHRDSLKIEEISTYLRQHFQAWQVPKQQDIHLIDAIPKTSVGKFDKRALRAKLAGM